MESMNEVEVRSSKQREDLGIEPLLIPPPTPSFVCAAAALLLGLKRDDKPLSPQKTLVDHCAIGAGSLNQGPFAETGAKLPHELSL